MLSHLFDTGYDEGDHFKNILDIRFVCIFFIAIVILRIINYSDDGHIKCHLIVLMRNSPINL